MATILSEKVFARFEAEFRPHLAAVGLDESIFARPDLEVPIEKYTALIERVAEMDDPCFGLVMGQCLEPTDLGVLGHALLAAPSIGKMLETLSRYLYVFAQDNSIRLDVSSNRAIVSYRYLAPGVSEYQRDIEFAVTAIAKVVNSVAGKTIVPRYVELEHPRPPYHKRYFSVYKCDVLFESGGNRLHYDSSVLKCPVPTSDPRLFEALQFYLDDQLKVRGQDDDLVHKLQHLVTASLHSGIPELKNVADALGIGERTLQRRLRRLDIVYSDLVENTRKSIALEYIRGTNYRLTDIAQILGYSEASAFTRAFKRWTGSTPGQIRKTAKPAGRVAVTSHNQ